MKNPRIWFDKLFEPARESDPRTATAWAWNDLRNPVRRVLPAAPHQAFRLRIDEAGGVFRVPGGPIEHWAVIYGVLEEGALWPNDRIVLSVAGGRGVTPTGAS